MNRLLPIVSRNHLEPSHAKRAAHGSQDRRVVVNQEHGSSLGPRSWIAV